MSLIRESHQLLGQLVKVAAGIGTILRLKQGIAVVFLEKPLQSAADVARIADRPAAAASVCTTQPLQIPSAEATPTRRPWAMLEPRM